MGYYLVQVGAIIWSKFVFEPIFIVVSNDFWKHSIIILYVSFVPNFLSTFKYFQSRAQNVYLFSNFSVLHSIFEFLRVCKNNKIEVSAICCFFVVEKEEKDPKGLPKNNWNFWIRVCFFSLQKWPFRDASVSFSKWFAETTIFKMFLGARFLAKLSEKGNFGLPK